MLWMRRLRAMSGATDFYETHERKVRMRNINLLHCIGVRFILTAACLCMTCTVVRAATVVMNYDFKVVDDGYSNWFSNDPDGATAAGKYSCPVGGSISTNTQMKLTSGEDTVATENTLAAASPPTRPRLTPARTRSTFRFRRSRAAPASLT